MVLMYARYFTGKLSTWMGGDAWLSVAQLLFQLVPAATGLVLLALGSKAWRQMHGEALDVRQPMGM